MIRIRTKFIILRFEGDVINAYTQMCRRECKHIRSALYSKMKTRHSLARVKKPSDKCRKKNWAPECVKKASSLAPRVSLKRVYWAKLSQYLWI